MDRRVFLGTVSAVALGLSGCVSSDEDEDVRVEVAVHGFDQEDYGGSLSVTHVATGDVVMEESFGFWSDMEESTEDGIASGKAGGGGYFHGILTKGDSYRVDVSVDAGVSESYEWTLDGEEFGLKVWAFPDRVEFEEGPVTFDGWCWALGSQFWAVSRFCDVLILVCGFGSVLGCGLGLCVFLCVY